MSELRWTLLILGVVFILALSWWERRRPRQAFAPRLRQASPPHTGVHRLASADVAAPAEPWIGESGLSDVVLSDATLANAPATRAPAAAANGPAHLQPGPLDALPIVVVSDPHERLALEGEALSAERPGTTPGSLRSAATKSEGALGNGALPPWMAIEAPPEPKLIDPQARATDEPFEFREPPEPPAPPEAGEPPGEALEAMTPAEPATAASELGPEITSTVESAPASAGDGRVEPIVEWPPEESRRILSLRVVAPPTERFPGRSLRLALAAEGFLLGKFSIFHKPDETNRAVLSAASLTRPGAFDLDTMDSQRYGGLSLFAVLPGENSPPQAFEELLAAARNLNERLQGALQDERGSPLTALRLASLRESLRAEAAILATASGE
ncbi:MAG: cell division protein ZipA C-terminal FtsZ-binding domain-containing protein [Steroidobacteraceae bacterium]